MTIISIFICNSSSNIIFARQFAKISRKELEEHSLIFNRSINSDKDSTLIETDTNRYLYIHYEECYIVLVTTKDSNIIEDMEVLKLTYRLISDICFGKISEDNIIDNAFDIALGLDDIVSLGMYDGANMFQLKQYLIMDSAEEKEFKRLQKEKEQAAAEHLKISMMEIERNKRMNKKVFLSDAIGSDSITLGGNLNQSNLSDDIKVNQSNNSKKVLLNELSEEEDYNKDVKEIKSKNKNKNNAKKIGKSKGMLLGKKKEVKTKESNNNESKLKHNINNY